MGTPGMAGSGIVFVHLLCEKQWRTMAKAVIPSFPHYNALGAAVGVWEDLCIMEPDLARSAPCVYVYDVTSITAGQPMAFLSPQMPKQQQRWNCFSCMLRSSPCLQW
jgi:hypothetical protein